MLSLIDKMLREHLHCLLNELLLFHYFVSSSNNKDTESIVSENSHHD